MSLPTPNPTPFRPSKAAEGILSPLASVSERRAHPRYLCWIEALCSTEEYVPQLARLLDLSASGARVALLQPILREANLRLTIPCGVERVVVLECTCTRVQRTPQGWEAGCTFTLPLNDEQLADLIATLDLE